MTHASPAATVPPAGAVPEPPRAGRSRWRPGRVPTCAAATLAALAAAASGHPAGPAVALGLAALAVGGGAAAVHRGAWAGLRRGALRADLLPSAGLLATLGAAAWATPYAAVAAAGATTVLVAGRAAQERLGRRAGAPLAALADGPGPGAGALLVVGSGERVTLDAVVVEGRSAVEVAGVPTPVEVGAGDPVPAGARNAGNRLVLAVDEPDEAAAPAGDVRGPAAEARRGAAVLDHLGDRVARRSAAVVVVLAVAVLGFWLGAGAAAGVAVDAAAATLLVACPAVVGCAAAAALLAATGRAVELGSLPATPRMLARAARIDTVVLCRTGTVTTGVQRLRTVHVADGVDADEALRIAGAVAQEAARDLVVDTLDALVVDVLAPAARDRFGELPGVAEFDRYPDVGVRGVVTELLTVDDGEPRVIAHAALLGHATLLDAHGIALPPELAAALERAHAAGSAAVAMSWDGVARAVLEIDDPVRPGSAVAVAGLRRLGIAPVLLTGDDTGATHGLAAVLDAAEAVSGTDGSAVAGLRERGRTVAVLGGPADAAALAAADVPLLRSWPDGPAGVVLRGDDPLTAVDALRVARRAVRTVERLAVGTVAYHVAALPVAAVGLLPPVAAAAAGVVWGVGSMACAAGVRRVDPLPRPVS